MGSFQKWKGATAPTCTTMLSPNCSGSSIGSFTAGTVQFFKANYVCGTGSGCTPPPLFDFVITGGMSATSVLPLTPTAMTLPTTPGTYTITFYAKCSGNVCAKCEYKLRIISCCPGTWGTKRWDNTAACSIPLATGGMLTYAGPDMYFNVVYNCPTGCTPPAANAISYNFYNSTGGLISPSPYYRPSGLSGPIPVPTGAVALKVFAYCGSSPTEKCDSIVTRLRNCCTGGAWGVRRYSNYTTWSLGTYFVHTVPITSTAGGTGVPIYFDMNYTCATGCTASIKYEFFNSSSVLIAGAGATYPSGITGPGITVPAGAASVKVSAICGGTVCDVFSISITSPPCCAGSSWGMKEIKPITASGATIPPLTVGVWNDVSSIPCTPGSTPTLTFHNGHYYEFRYNYNCASGCSPCNIRYQVLTSAMVPWLTSQQLCGNVETIRMPFGITDGYLRVFTLCGSVPYAVCNVCLYKIIFVP